MLAPLCAWVIEPDHRLCRRWGIYLVDGQGGRRYCRGHAERVGKIVGRIGMARRELYGGTAARRARTWNSDEPAYLIAKGIGSMPFEVEAKVGGEYNAEDYAPAGIYEAVVESVQPYEGTKYMSDEKQIQARVTWSVRSGPYAGKKAERLYSPSLNTMSRLYPVFQALTGITPTPGERYDIEALLVGKPAQIVVMEHTTQAGNHRTRVENVLPLAIPNGAAKPKKTRVIEVDDDEDDDLEGT